MRAGGGGGQCGAATRAVAVARPCPSPRRRRADMSAALRRTCRCPWATPNHSTPTHLEQLARLRLDALGAVDQHDGIVSRRQRAVRVLAEVAVPGRVQDVELEPRVGKGHGGGADADATRLLQLHPVCRSRRHGRGHRSPLSYDWLAVAPSPPSLQLAPPPHVPTRCMHCPSQQLCSAVLGILNGRLAATPGPLKAKWVLAYPPLCIQHAAPPLKRLVLWRSPRPPPHLTWRCACRPGL